MVERVALAACGGRAGGGGGSGGSGGGGGVGRGPGVSCVLDARHGPAEADVLDLGGDVVRKAPVALAVFYRCGFFSSMEFEGEGGNFVTAVNSRVLCYTHTMANM